MPKAQKSVKDRRAERASGKKPKPEAKSKAKAKAKGAAKTAPKRK